jgi:hypothetical protein
MALQLRGAKFADRNVLRACFLEKDFAAWRKLKASSARVLGR